MNLLIKGMKMPVNCQTCPFVENAFRGGYDGAYNNYCGLTSKLCKKSAFERNKDCPLEEVKK